MTKSLKAIYKQNKNKKKHSYNERVMQFEKASFTSIMFMKIGGMGRNVLFSTNGSQV